MLRGYTRNRIVSEGARDWSECPAGPMSVPGRTNLNARRDQSALFHLLADLIISALCFWRPVCLCFVFIPGQYFFLAVGSLLFQADVVLWSQWCFFGRWLELFSSPGVLFLSNWWLEYTQNMLPGSNIFPAILFSFPRHPPVQALFAPPPTVLHPVVIAGCWAGPRFRPAARSAWPVTRTEADVVEAHPSLFWCQDSAVVCISASRLRGELVTVWAWAVCRLQ